MENIFSARPTAGSDTTGEENAKRTDLMVKGLVVLERGLLILVAGLTLIAAGQELLQIARNGAVSLADLLLMFLYTEVIAMVAVFYASRTMPVFYPIFIAITALARLLVLQSKEMDPEKILYEALAILLLALSGVVLKYVLNR